MNIPVRQAVNSFPQDAILMGIPWSASTFLGCVTLSLSPCPSWPVVAFSSLLSLFFGWIRCQRSGHKMQTVSTVHTPRKNFPYIYYLLPQRVICLNLYWDERDVSIFYEQVTPIFHKSGESQQNCQLWEHRPVIFMFSFINHFPFHMSSLNLSCLKFMLWFISRI